MKARYSVVFMGTPEFSVPTLEALHAAGHEIRLVVTRPDKPQGRGRKLDAPPVKKAALQLKRPVIQPTSLRDETARQALQTAQADFVQARARLLSAQQALLNFGLPLNAEALRGLSEADLLSHLRLLGIPETMSRDLPAYEATANLLPVRAPLDAVIVERQVVAGEVVDRQALKSRGPPGRLSRSPPSGSGSICWTGVERSISTPSWRNRSANRSQKA